MTSRRRFSGVSRITRPTNLAHNSEHKYTGENTGRRLRYLETCYDVAGTPKEEPEHVQARRLLSGGYIRVEYGKKHAAWYWFEPPTESTQQLIQRGLIWFASLPTGNIKEAAN
jgi:hypothetical protein